MAVVEYKKEGRIAIFTLNRPEVLNAVNIQVLRELSESLIDFRDDPELWVGIITGAGEKAFCSGADIKEFFPWLEEHRDQHWAQPPTIQYGLELWKPIIAAINGLALGGGCELAIACDIRIASENARIGQTEVKWGGIAGGGGTQRLARLIPLGKALEMLLMGIIIDAQEAYRIGLVSKVVPQDKLMSTAKEWAETICEAGPLAVRATKEAVIRGSNMTLEDGLALENLLEAGCLRSEDFKEAIAAFREKRKAVYKGK